MSFEEWLAESGITRRHFLLLASGEKLFALKCWRGGAAADPTYCAKLATVIGGNRLKNDAYHQALVRIGEQKRTAPEAAA